MHTLLGVSISWIKSCNGMVQIEIWTSETRIRKYRFVNQAIITPVWSYISKG